MALTGHCTEDKIWNYLKKKGLNDYGTAGLMGNLYAESGLKATNLQNSYEKSIRMTDAEYTKAVDKGTYHNFVKDQAGYGLAQWTYWSRKKCLLEYAISKCKSIGDLEMQLGFLVKELTENYPSVMKSLKSATSVRQASDVVLLKFERPANSGTAVQEKRASFGEKYYKKYATSKRVHVVKKGETLSVLAKMYGTSYKEIAIANGIANPNLILTGQKLIIP